MRIALLNAPYAAAYGPLKSASGRYFPLGLGYLSAVLRQAGHEVVLLDPEASRLGDDAIAVRLRSFGPRLVGITCATPTFPAARRLAVVVRSAVPGAVVILGGVHATALPGAVLAQAPEIDLVGLGEGEETVVELAARLADGPLPPDVLAGIPGIAWRDRGEPKVNAMRPWIRDLDALPFPARDLADFDDYVPHAHNRRGRRATTAISSRGCPYPCVFCASHVVLGRGFRCHSPEYVVGEIEHLVRNHGVDQVIYNDDVFTTNRARDERICELILQRNLRVSWFCFARADGVTPDLLRLMKRAGCYSVGFGIESGDPGVLKAIRKNETVDQMRQAVGWANAAGLKTQCFFVFGNPGETPEAVERTIRFSIELSPALAFFNMMVPYPGTEAFRACFGEQGPPLDRVRWEDWVAVGPHAAVTVPGLPPLERLVADANRRFYLRPGQVLRMLAHASNVREVWQLFRGALALAAQILLWRRTPRAQAQGEPLYSRRRNANMALDLTSFEKAVASLDEALTARGRSPEPEGSPGRKLLRDAAIQRFEYTFELARKFLKRYLEVYGLEQADGFSHKDLFRVGFEQGMVRDSAPWIEYLKKRNLTSHVYDDEVAGEVFRVIPGFLDDARFLLGRIREKAR